MVSYLNASRISQFALICVKRSYSEGSGRGRSVAVGMAACASIFLIFRAAPTKLAAAAAVTMMTLLMMIVSEREYILI